MDTDPELRRWRTQLKQTHSVSFFGLEPSTIQIGPALGRWVGAAPQPAVDDKLVFGREPNDIEPVNLGAAAPSHLFAGDDFTAYFTAFVEALRSEVEEQLRQLRHIEAEGRVIDRKYQAGANTLVRRQRTFIRKAEPPRVKTNVETIALGVGRQTLHFFPDRLLVFDRQGVGAVPYSDLRMEIAPVQFIESESVPRDAQVVGRTWQYVNKKGGPDRRFRNNRELPVCLYEYVHFTSASGLNEQIQLSRVGVAENFAKAIAYLGSKIVSAEPHPAEVRSNN